MAGQDVPVALGVVIGVGCRPAFLREADRSPEPPTPAPTGSRQPALPALLLVSTCGLATVNTRELSGKRPAFTDARGRWCGAESRAAPRPQRATAWPLGCHAGQWGPPAGLVCVSGRAAGPPACQPAASSWACAPHQPRAPQCLPHSLMLHRVHTLSWALSPS